MMKIFILCFRASKHRSQRLFSGIFIDPHNMKNTGWVNGQWWLHVSYNLCEGDGEPNFYTKAGVFHCAHERPGYRRSCSQYPL
jgi:hypothetical protein